MPSIRQCSICFAWLVVHSPPAQAPIKSPPPLYSPASFCGVVEITPCALQNNLATRRPSKSTLMQLITWAKEVTRRSLVVGNGSDRRSFVASPSFVASSLSVIFPNGKRDSGVGSLASSLSKLLSSFSQRASQSLSRARRFFSPAIVSGAGSVLKSGYRAVICQPAAPSQ